MPPLHYLAKNLSSPVRASSQRIDCAYQSTGAASSSASMRSSMPPWPGSRLPESFTPAERLSADSARSPTCEATLSSTAMISQYHHTSSAMENFVKFNLASSAESQ